MVLPRQSRFRWQSSLTKINQDRSDYDQTWHPCHLASAGINWKYVMNRTQKLSRIIAIFLLGMVTGEPRTADRIISHREAVLHDTTTQVYKSGIWSDGNMKVPYSLRMHIVYPPQFDGDKQYPAMIMVHGGGFRTGNFQQFLIQADFFSKRGIICFLPEYRLRETNTLGQPGFPTITIQEQLTDIKRAIRWVRHNAEAHNVDTSRIIGWGGSAGGYLISSATMIPLPEDFSEFQADESPPYASTDLSALILVNPALDLSFYNVPQWRLSLDPEATLQGLTPTFHVKESTPPALLFNGAEDTTTPLYMVEEFKGAMEAEGKADFCELIVYENTGHGFANKDPYLDATMKRTATFLRKFGLTDKELDPLHGAESYSYKENNNQEFDLSLELRVLKPPCWDVADRARYPAGIFLHAGPIVAGEKALNDPYEIAALARDFAKNRGFVSIVPDYQHPYTGRTQYKSGSIKDVRAIFRWARENFENLKLDPSRLAAFGTGYGAHLALSTFVEDYSFDYIDDDQSISPEPNALVLINPILSLDAVRSNEEMNIISDDFLYWAEGQDTVNRTDFSEFRRLDVPIYLIEGLADETYPHLEDDLDSDLQFPQGGYSFYSESAFLAEIADFSGRFLEEQSWISPGGPGDTPSLDGWLYFKHFPFVWSHKQEGWLYFDINASDLFLYSYGNDNWRTLEKSGEFFGGWLYFGYFPIVWSQKEHSWFYLKEVESGEIFVYSFQCDAWFSQETG